MTRRLLFTAFAAAALGRAADPGTAAIRGTLTQHPDGRPAIKTQDGLVPLTGDEETMLVLRDKRLAGADFEVAGRFAAGVFTINPIHTRSMFVHRGGKRLAVSYWCDICYIRTWSPGTCWCCQEDTRLDPVDPATLDDTNKKK